jgi:hypothetical protein
MSLESRHARRQRALWWLLLLPLATLPLYGQTDSPAQEIAGLYYCEGSNGDGTPYRGVVNIVKRGDAYHVWWKLQPGAEAVGLAIRSGDALAVSYYGQATGVVLYRIVGDQLIGQWTVPGGEGVLASETLTPIEEVPAYLFEPDPAPAPADAGPSPPIRL